MKVRDILYHNLRAPDYAVIYIFRDGDQVMYIGKSWNVEQRIFDHFSIAFGYLSFSCRNEFAMYHYPEFLDWDIEFVELPKDIDAGADWWIRQKESALINDLKPRYNAQR